MGMAMIAVAMVVLAALVLWYQVDEADQDAETDVE